MLSEPTYCTVDEGAKQLNLRLQLRQLEVNCLVVENWLLEDLPLLRVLDGFLNDIFHCGQN